MREAAETVARAMTVAAEVGDRSRALAGYGRVLTNPAVPLSGKPDVEPASLNDRV
jgi:hypothetical protein